MTYLSQDKSVSSMLTGVGTTEKESSVSDRMSGKGGKLE